jgi:hypothetical protein
MTHPFITHNGGTCPVSPETRVDVRFRDGQSKDFSRPASAFMKLNAHDDDWWQWQGLPANNIIAYRLHQPDKGEAS